MQALGQEGAIYALRSYLRGLSGDGAAAWVRECPAGLRREWALAALAIEHPAESEAFFDTAQRGTRQLMLQGWAQSRPAKVLAGLNLSTDDPDRAMDAALTIPVLLRHHFAETVARFRDSSGHVTLPLPLLRDWATLDPHAALRELGKGSDGAFGTQTLWAAMSDEYVNRRDPWLLGDFIRQATPEEAAAVADAFAKDGNRGTNLALLASATGTADHLPEDVLAAIPGARAAGLLADLRAGSQPDSAALAETAWTDAQAREFAAVAVEAHPERVASLLADRSLPQALANALAATWARSDPAGLAGADVPPAVALAGLAQAGRASDYFASDAHAEHKIDDLLPGEAAWRAAGLAPQQAAQLVFALPERFREAEPWVAAAVSSWLKDLPVMASSEIAKLPAGPVFDAAAAALVEHVAADGQLIAARAWFRRLSPARQAALAKVHPELAEP